MIWYLYFEGTFLKEILPGKTAAQWQALNLRVATLKYEIHGFSDQHNADRPGYFTGPAVGFPMSRYLYARGHIE
jgi:hypothetical protein|tara:strand:+ start:1069 stop:1290 length:222 start_codon:yes stop_codon:yes gene_type:complete